MNVIPNSKNIWIGFTRLWKEKNLEVVGIA